MKCPHCCCIFVRVFLLVNTEETYTLRSSVFVLFFFIFVQLLLWSKNHLGSLPLCASVHISCLLCNCVYSQENEYRIELRNHLIKQEFNSSPLTFKQTKCSLLQNKSKCVTCIFYFYFFGVSFRFKRPKFFIIFMACRT